MNFCCGLTKEILTSERAKRLEELTKQDIPEYIKTPIAEVLQDLVHYCPKCGFDFIKKQEVRVPKTALAPSAIVAPKNIPCGVCRGTGYADGHARIGDDPDAIKCMYCLGKGIFVQLVAPAPIQAEERIEKLTQQIIKENKPVRDTTKELPESEVDWSKVQEKPGE